jgi:hypothetical protein
MTWIPFEPFNWEQQFSDFQDAKFDGRLITAYCRLASNYDLLLGSEKAFGKLKKSL